MVVLNFPKSDPRSSGKPLLKNRPWLFHGANGIIIRNPRIYHYTTRVHFNKSPKGTYDLVSPEFLKS